MVNPGPLWGSLLAGVVALGTVAKLKGRTLIVAQCLFYGGYLCLLQRVAVLLGVV